MLLGKRPRPPMKRTTSMTEFSLDLNHTTVVDVSGDNSQPPYDHPNNMKPPRSTDAALHQPLLSATVAPKNHRRKSADFIETTHFLRACHLCNRRLIAGRDIFMYRGDSAFCSLECRQQQMNEDEKKDKRSMLPKKQPNESETVAAM